MKAADVRDEVEGVVETWLDRVPDGRLRLHTDGLWRLHPDGGTPTQAFRIVVGVQEVTS